jgi:hypothetical protein
MKKHRDQWKPLKKGPLTQKVEKAGVLEAVGLESEPESAGWRKGRKNGQGYLSFKYIF